jgi:hypothetical protein
LLRKRWPFASAASIRLSRSVGERVERAEEVVTVHPDVERKMVAGTGGNADERDIVCERGCGEDGE